MGVSLIAAKKRRSIGRIGNSAKNAKRPPKGPAPLPNSIRRTKSHRSPSVAAKKTSTQNEPTTCKSSRPQKKNERTIGHREIRRTVGFSGFFMLEDRKSVV